MLAQSSTLGVIAVVLLSLSLGRVPSFTLRSAGAIDLDVAGDEARYGVTPLAVEGGRMFTISLGATGDAGSLTLSMPGDRPPARGRYQVRTWERRGTGEQLFQALVVAGKPDRPLGALRGESGWVTITNSEPGWISGEFELEARGFVVTELEDEDRWVRVRGRFEARGDATKASAWAASAAR